MRAEPLGSLLTGRGHITEEQLELALNEQRSTGRPLGEIIVARGFAPGPTIAQALATQHGGLLKTEYGFATGWGGQENSVARAPAPAEAAPAPSDAETVALRASLEEHQKALEAWKQAHAKLVEELTEARSAAPAALSVDDSHLVELEALKGERDSLRAELAEAHRAATAAPVVDETRIAELEGELAAMRSQLTERVEDPRVGELESELAAVRSQLAEAEARAAQPVEPVEDPRLAELSAECDSLRSQLSLRTESIEQLEAKLSTVERACADLEQSLAHEVEHGEAVRAELAAKQQAPAEPVEDPRLAELSAECESLRSQLSLRAESIEQLEAKLSTVETAWADLERALAHEVERGDAARAELAAKREAPAGSAGRWDAAESHLVFFQGSLGYELHERKGPPPAEGSSVGKQIVARIGRAPFPGSTLPCAYLAD